MKRLLVLILLLSNVGVVVSQTANGEKLSIEDLFTIAESNNRSLRLSDFAEREALQAVDVVKNSQLPSLDLSLSASYLGDAWISDRDFSDGMTAAMPHFGNNFVIEASQVVYAGGAIKNSVSNAELQHRVAQIDKELTRQNVRFMLVANYLELFKLHNQAEVYLKNIEQTQKLVSDIQAKQREGLVLKNDITRYELQLQSLELALTQVRNGMSIVNNRLVILLGLPLGTVIAVDTDILLQLPDITAENAWQQTAADTAPTLRMAKIRTEQAKQTEKIVNAERLPSVALFAGDHFDGPITIEVPPIDKNLNYWYVGVGVKFNVASLYKTKKEVRLAKLSTEQSMETEQMLKENIQTEVNAAHIRFAESFTILQTQMKSLELATQNYTVINNRYINDLALITDMLDASNSKLEAELQMANARINILFNYYNLKRAVGTL